MRTSSVWSRQLHAVLEQLGDDASLGDGRFVARNFLLERRLSGRRIDGYEQGSSAVHDYPALIGHHTRYLAAFIHRPAPAHGIPRAITSTDAPVTFTIDPMDARFRGSAEDLLLVRMVPLRTLARLADRSMAEARAAIDDLQLLEDLVADVNERLRLQPTFAAFWEDVADLVPDDDGTVVTTWPDDLRDALGMSHLVPPPGASIPIVLLLYGVKDVPKIVGRRGHRPLVEPTVLDSELFHAFCPAPTGAPAGCLVNMAGDLDRDPAGELLHPTVRLRGDHVVRTGEVTTTPRPLARARAAHLTMLQDRYDPAYATETDSDILAAY
jgi:hypothetical protein